MVRTCQSSLGQTGTCLGLLLLHVGPHGDGFGGQAFMEHYSVTQPWLHCLILIHHMTPVATLENVSHR
jgi:hypothetical protein